MRLAYFSPLNPQPSGISDYSEELLPYLAAHADIDVFVDGFRPSNEQLASFNCFDYRKDPSTLDSLPKYDAALYHMGNDHRYHSGIFRTARTRAGIVVFHDFSLQDFFLGRARDQRQPNVYLDELEACHGRRERAKAEAAVKSGGVPLQHASPLEFPLNCRLARSAEGIIVHSDWNAERFATIAPGVPVARIKHHITARAANTPAAIKNASENGRVMIASFGLVTPDKGIDRALRALATLRHDHDFHYTLVGSAINFPDLPDLLRRYGLEDRVSVTGYVSLDEFQQRILETDIAINLRERSVGATSGSLCRIMAAGVPAIISNVGAFSEFPDDAVVKIDHDRHSDALLQAYLRKLIEDAPLRARIGQNARRYVLAEHNIEASAVQYAGFVREVIARRPRKQLLDNVINEMSLLGVRADDDAILRDVATELAMVAPVSDFAAEIAHTLEARNDAGQKPAREQGRFVAKEDVFVAQPNVPQIRAVSSDNGQQSPADSTADSPGRFPKVEGIDYRRGALEYAAILDDELTYYLKTKPFCNVGGKNRRPFKHSGDGMDPETHRHFNDFANMAAVLALRAGAKILDVGCGPGWLSEYFARMGYDVTGIDISDDLIQIARERVERLPYQVDHRTPLRCQFLTHDIETEPLTKKFDGIICYDALHHFEDERKVFRHLAAMLDVGGLLFILEGQKPSAGSATEEILREIMRDYRTLESPFSEAYLRALLNDHGFAVVGDYVSVNGLFEREMLEQDERDLSLPLRTIDISYHYLTCMKVAEGAPASIVPDSRRPGILRAQLTPMESLPTSVAPGAKLELPLSIRNDGDTLWLTGQTVRAGMVMPGIKIFDGHGNTVSETHGPLLPRAVAPGRSITVTLEFQAPCDPGTYTVKIDLVDQHVCWFEERGSEPLKFVFESAHL